MADIKIELVKTAILAFALLILLFPYFINRFPGFMNADYVALGTGRSMLPTIQEGDLVAIRGTWLSDIEVGDVLAVRFGRLRIVHRLVEIIAGETMFFRLKGDGNERSDPILFEASQIMGKVVAIYPSRGLYTLSTGFIISLITGALLLINIWTSPNVDFNSVLLSLILSISLANIIGYMLKVVT